MLEGVVTAVEPQRRRGGKRCNVFLDGRYAFSLESEVAVGLRVGEPLSEAQRAELLSKDQAARCYDAALRFLAARPRSEQEVRRRLAEHGHPGELIDRAIEKLREYRLLDDTAFAQFWIEQRQTHRPRGARLLKLELRQKGLTSEQAGEALAELGDEAESAYQAAAKRARTLRGLDERTFRQRLGAFLQRRGFDYEVSAVAVKRLWNELEPERPP
ncbi:MAG: RecX family transcriptional regulator [Chloroflexi bacterium]|nr:RecX family transcriptional regulator [Chloroflexota bacterium]